MKGQNMPNGQNIFMELMFAEINISDFFHALHIYCLFSYKTNDLHF